MFRAYTVACTYCRCYGSQSHPIKQKAKLRRNRYYGVKNEVMKAAQVVRYGEVTVNEVPIPSLKKDQILVKVCAASLNPLDKMMINSYGKKLFEAMRPLPFTIGRDGAGVVVDAGDSWRFKKGDQVWFAPNPLTGGTMSDFCAVSQYATSHKPKTLNFEQSASLAYVSLTAYRSLYKLGASVKEGSRVLIHGGYGAVGHFAAQYLIKTKSCDVTITCNSRNIEEAEKFGVKAFAYDKDDPDWTQLPKKSFDFVLDAAGLSELEATSMQLLKTDGCYVTLRGNLVVNVDRTNDLASGLGGGVFELLSKKMQYYSQNKVHYDWGLFWPGDDTMRHLADVIDKHDIVPHAVKEFALDDMQDALQQMGKSPGKIVVKPYSAGFE